MDLTTLVLAAPHVDASTRARSAEMVGETRPGTIVLRTCHRLELIGGSDAIATIPGLIAARRLEGEDAVRHVLRVAVGLESTVVAEDQILHQLRAATRAARATGGLSPTVGHVVDTALRHGRQARSWLPAGRPGLADAALDRLPGRGLAAGALATVIGRGPMGRLLAHAIADRGARVVQLGRDGVPAPGSSVVAFALAGPWRPGADIVDALARSGAAVIDLSAPATLDEATLHRLAGRIITIDDLGDMSADGHDPLGERLRDRLEGRVERALAEVRAWVSLQPEHRLARSRAERAGEATARELEALWRRLPDLAPGQRAEIERMVERLSERLLFSL
jgi:glutamyl-tRNA reductase